MLDQDYINQVQQALSKHYSNDIDNTDDHHVEVYTNPADDNAYIAYHPYWLDNHNDNSGKVSPLRTIIIHAVAKNGKWTTLTNQQFIHGQKFTQNHYEWNLNYRKDNAIDDTGKHKLRGDLKKKFHISITSSGLLEISVSDKFTRSFSSMIKAIQFLTKDGANYTEQAKVDPVKQAEEDLRLSEDAVNDADKKYRAEKAKHTSKRRHHNSKLPKAHGKVVAGFSSTAGTPREIRYAKERKHRRARDAYLKKHPEIVKERKQKKAEELAHKKYDLANCKVVLLGRLNHSRKYYQKYLDKIGAKVQQRVNSQTDYVICDRPNKSKNYQAAVKNHIRIIKDSQIKNS